MGVAQPVRGVALVFVSPGAGIAFACLGFVGLFLAVFIGVLTAAADQPNPTRKNFGGRYTDFGFLFGVWMEVGVRALHERLLTTVLLSGTRHSDASASPLATT